MKKVFIALSLACLLLTAGAENLLLTPGKNPLAGWGRKAGIVFSENDGLLNVTIDGPVVTGRRVKIKPEWKYLLLSMKMRPTDLVPGKASWQNGRLAMRFHGKDGKAVGAWPEVFGFSGTRPFQSCQRLYEIPEGATNLSVNPANFGSSGRIEFADMSLTALTSIDQLDKDAPVPDGSSQTALWSVADAWRETTPTREQLSLNGLWQFFPITKKEEVTSIPPARSGWCYFKVPGVWPGKKGWKNPGDYQTVYRSAFRDAFDDQNINSAWYRRTVITPAGWQGRRIELDFTMLQTSAQVFVDGKPAGELFYPGGKVNLTGKLIPGKEQELAILVSAKADGLTDHVFMAPGRLMSVEAKVGHRGITGDLFLSSVPEEAAIADVHVITRVRDRKILCDVGFEAVSAPGEYRLEAEICDADQVVKRFESPLFRLEKPGRYSFGADWIAPKLWDIDTPQNLYFAKIVLKKANGKPVDVFYPQEFGFREFWIDGRNFMLNGSVIHLRSFCNSSISDGAARSAAENARETARRVRSVGFNHLISYDYSFASGVIGYPDAFYKECSKAGVLTSLTMPHAKDFQWKLDDPATRERYRAYSEYIIRRFQNVPGIVLYAMSHNATGYFGDQNPQKIDGIYSPDALLESDSSARANQRRQALTAAGVVKSLDSTRPVYHHESGNLGDAFTINCYLNWAPAQERSDWLEHWEKEGVKPVVMVEWGMPHVASWSSYRGPGFIWRNSGVQCLWLNEFNAALLGEEAYRSTPAKQAAYRLQEKLSTGNKPINFNAINRVNGHPDTNAVRALMVRDNFRDLRARGLSGLLPWDQGTLWWRKSVQPGGENAERFHNLKRPGIVPDTWQTSGGDFLVDRLGNYELSPIGMAGLPYLAELTAWIAGKQGDFTEKGHNFAPGETVEKTVMVLNDSRRFQTVKIRWAVPELSRAEEGSLQVEPGRRGELPVRFQLPADCSLKMVTLQAEIQFENGKTVSDRFPVDVVTASAEMPKRLIGLFDPQQRSAELLERAKIPYRRIRNSSDLAGVELLVVGRGGLAKLPFALDGWMETGGRLLVLEQDFNTLATFGFRSNEYGLRTVFPLVHSFHDRTIRDWRGSSTLTAPYLEHLPELELNDPKWSWHGFDNTRVWRSGNRGNVNSVLLEKPTVGNFLPLMQGGFDLQYTPAVELKSGKGVAIFSQFDLSARSENDPEAVELFRKLLLRADRSMAAETLPTFYCGNDEGARWLKSLRIACKQVETVPEQGVLIVGPGAKCADLSAQIARGLRVIALGLSGRELETLLPGAFRSVPGKYYSDYQDKLADVPEFEGISNADLHWRKELAFDALAEGGEGGAALRLIRAGKGKLLALQVVPWMFDPQEFQYRTSVRRSTFALSRLLHNLGAESVPGVWKRLNPRHQEPISEWVFQKGWVGLADPENVGRRSGYFGPDFRPDQKWRMVKVPGRFDLQFADLRNYDGLFWYRLEFNLPKLLPDKEYTLSFGAIDDESWIWLNGKFIGELTQKTNPEDYWSTPRVYSLNGSDFREGRNTLTVLCNDIRYNGGILGTPRLATLPELTFYADFPMGNDDPYRYYRW